MGEKKSVVAIVKCNTYQQDEVNTALKKCLDYIGGIRIFIKNGDKVLLKPNLLAPTPPEDAVTTHPNILRALVKLIEMSGGIPWIGDSSGGPFSGLTSKALEICGINKIAQETSAEIKNFDTNGVAMVPNPNGRFVKEFKISKIVKEADVIISVPKLKIHEQLLLTGAVKNFVGVIPGAGKRDLHYKAVKAHDLSQSVLDLYTLVNPRLSIMDAVIGLEGKRMGVIEGAGFGTPRKIGLIMASTDAIALDAVAAVVMGYEPMKISTIRHAHERGIGIGDIEKITIYGENLDNVKVKNFVKASNYLLELLPSFISESFVNQYISSKPMIHQDTCKKCGLCKDSCPMGSICLEPIPVIDYASCIRCYCCHEVCSNKAIVLKKSRFARYLIRSKGLNC